MIPLAIFDHQHDWGGIVNKPNLVEGIFIGGNRITFRLTNGDTITANFGDIVARVDSLEYWRTNPQGAEQAFRDLQADVASIQANKADAADVASLQSSVSSLQANKADNTVINGIKAQRGMVVDPYVWGPSAGAEDWAGCEDEYWYDTASSMLKICIKVEGGVPYFNTVIGKYLLWDEGAGTLNIYTCYDPRETPTMTTIFTE